MAGPKLLADLIERGLQPDIARLFVVDGAKALSRAVRDTFGLSPAPSMPIVAEYRVRAP